MNIPHGIDEITRTYGDITHYIREDGTLDHRWEIDKLGLYHSPIAFRLAWSTDKTVTSIRCHKLIIEPLREAIDLVMKYHLEEELQFFGGCFQFRMKRSNYRLSLHSWGVALDFNPLTNQAGSRGNMSPNIVAIFKTIGAVWGGDWEGKNRDPMHFQFASGY